MNKRRGASGKPWTEEQYAEAGLARLALRLPIEALANVHELAERLGTSKADAVAQAVAEALRRMTPL